MTLLFSHHFAIFFLSSQGNCQALLPACRILCFHRKYPRNFSSFSFCLPKLKIATTDTSNQVSLDCRWHCAHLGPLTLLVAHCLPLKHLQRCCVCLLHITDHCTVPHHPLLSNYTCNVLVKRRTFLCQFSRAVAIHISSRWCHCTTQPTQNLPLSVWMISWAKEEELGAVLCFLYFF